MCKLVSSGRGHDLKQVSVCTSLIAVVGSMALSRLVYVQVDSSGRKHGMKEVSVCT